MVLDKQKKDIYNPFLAGWKIRLLVFPFFVLGPFIPFINVFPSDKFRFNLFIIATLSLGCATAIYRICVKRMQIRVNELAGETANKDFLLYLRPFSSSGKVKIPCKIDSELDRIILGPNWDFELGLSIGVWPLIPIISVGETTKGFGASKIIENDAAWRETVLTLANKSKVIVIMGLYGSATMWEINEIINSPSLIRKTMIVVPPMGVQYIKLPNFIRKKQFDCQYERMRSELLNKNLFLPKYNRKGFILIFDGRKFSKIPTLGFHHIYIKEIVSIMYKNKSEDIRSRLLKINDVYERLEASTNFKTTAF